MFAIVFAVVLSAGSKDETVALSIDSPDVNGYDYLLDLLSPISGKDALLNKNTALYNALQ